jgi:sugar O-acyltransferase (sialic acid O-acetyltransferase NeuD family)
MLKIVIIGGKGVAIDIAEQIINAREKFSEKIEFLGWAIDDESLGCVINDYPVLCKPGELTEKFNYPDVKLIFSLYKAGRMEERVNLLMSYGIEASRFANFVHPLSYVAKSVTLGVGNVILSHASVYSNGRIGDYNIVYSASVIGHDSRVGNNNFIASALIGSEVVMGNGNFIGMNASIRQQVEISDYTLIGMGSAVLRNIDSHEIVFGNPAKLRELKGQHESALQPDPVG